jgi:hypothetical protein
MVGARWEEIRIVDRSAVKEVGDRIEVEWMLSTKPELEWAEIFQMAALSDREGPVDWVMGGGPDVMGAVVRWFVPTEAIENADVEVKHRLAVANQRFGMGQQVQDAERADAAERSALLRQKLAATQARLDDLD